MFSDIAWKYWTESGPWVLAPEKCHHVIQRYVSCFLVVHWPAESLMCFDSLGDLIPPIRIPKQDLDDSLVSTAEGKYRRRECIKFHLVLTMYANAWTPFLISVIPGRM